MVMQELIKKIKEYFGLNIYETKAWLALLKKGVASAGEVAELSGVPRSRTYDVLESLEKRGFALMKLGKPIKYIAVKPSVVIEKLKSNAQKSAEEKINAILKLKKTQEYAELEQLYKTGIQPVKREELSGAIRGRLTIYKHIKELLESAKKEVIICISALEFQSKSRFFSIIFEKLKKREIKIKLALSGDERDIKRINKRYNLKAKSLDIDAKFFIADNEQVLFMISKGNSPEEDIAIWLNSSFFASALSFMFECAVKGK